MAVTTEIAPGVYRISISAPKANLQFNHFLVKAVALASRAAAAWR